MAVAEQIQESVQRLPAAFQAEALNFVEYLLAKAEREELRQEEQDRSSLSLASLMRGMDDEPDALYTVRVSSS